MTTDRKRGYLYILLAAMLYSTTEVALKALGGAFAPMQVTVERVLLGAAAQLGVGELGIGPQLRCADVCDLKNMGHTAPPDHPLGKGMFFSVYQSFPHPSTPGQGGSRAAAFLPLQRSPFRGTLN